jgi:hypothetical protein
MEVKILSEPSSTFIFINIVTYTKHICGEYDKHESKYWERHFNGEIKIIDNAAFLLDNYHNTTEMHVKLVCNRKIRAHITAGLNTRIGI